MASKLLKESKQSIQKGNAAHKEDAMKRSLIVLSLCLSLCAATAASALAGFNAGLSAYRQGDFAAALREFKADGGAQANFYLSVMYDKGEGVAQNRDKSVEMLTRAAEQGLDVAQANLGLMYCAGYIVKKDAAEGLKWLTKAAAQGLEEAQTVLLLAQAGN